MRKLFLAFLALVVSCGCGGLPTPHPVSSETGHKCLLRYRFSPGEEIRYLLRSSSSSRALGENPKVLSVEHEAEFRQNVLEVLPDGRARIVVVIDRLTFVMSRPGMEFVAFDSDDSDGIDGCPQEMRGMAFLVGKEIEIEQSPSGEVASAAGLAFIYRKALAELSANERQPLERLLREMAHKPSSLFGLDVVFPVGAISVGEKWSAERGPFPLFCGRLAYNCDYLLKEVSDGQAIVEFRGAVGASETRQGLEMQQVKKAEVQGILSLDLEKGALKEMRGESSSFLRVGGSEHLRARATWALTLRNERCPGAAESIVKTQEEG